MYEIIKLSVKTLLSNKLRTTLSMLWIVVWVVTIILVFAIWTWAQKAIEEQYKNLSVTTIMAMPINTTSSTSKLSDKDVPKLIELEHIQTATPIAQWRLLVSNSNDSEQFTILWVKSNFLEISKLKLETWKFFTQEDDKAKKKVAVLWSSVAESLFSTSKEAIWQTISIWKKKFEVIWVFSPSWTSVWPISYDDTVFIPYDTATKIVLWSNATIRLIILATDINSIDTAMWELQYELRKLHKLRASDPDDFRLRDQGSKVIAAQESTKTMKYLLIWVATIVLVVSWIWIMNVMFAQVAERTKEIWILKAIWAKNSDILNQFLIESVILSAVAWFIWVALWEIIIPFANWIEWITLIRSNFWDIIWFVFAVLTWIFFGWYPAYKASKLDPVDAIKSE